MNYTDLYDDSDKKDTLDTDAILEALERPSMKNHNPIEIDIDRLTPCLYDTTTNTYVDTHYEELSKPIPKEAYKNWKFDWSKTQKDGYKIFQLYVNDNPTVQGRISMVIDGGVANVDIVETAPHNYGHNGKYKGVGGHLFAIACEYSFKHNCDGYVAFTAKNKLIEHYQKTLGAKVISGQRMYIDTEAADKLIQTYIDKEDQK